MQALDGVTLTLGRGEVLGLAGESGCGKSTLAYGATRLLLPPPPGLITGGEVIFHFNTGQTTDLLTLDDADLRASRWRDIAAVFQGAMNALNPCSGSRPSSRTPSRPTARRRPGTSWRIPRPICWGLVGIARDRLRAYPHQLSGGMKQRVMIAMALALETQVLIMDEPTTALDVVMQRQIIEQLVELKESLGFSVIFITHDVSLLIETADRIAIMYAGGIVEQGPAHQLYRQPRHPYTKGLLSSFPPLHGPRTELSGIPGSPPDLHQHARWLPLQPALPLRDGPVPRRRAAPDRAHRRRSGARPARLLLAARGSRRHAARAAAAPGQSLSPSDVGRSTTSATAHRQGRLS